MKKFLFLLLAVTAGTAPAQTLVYPGEHEMPPVPKTFDNELGVRYGAQLYVGDGRGPELQAFSIDYARYNFYNIGFRTGLNVFVDEDAENYFSVPLQFTWRTGRIASSWRRESRERSVQNNYYNGSYADPYGRVRRNQTFGNPPQRGYTASSFMTMMPSVAWRRDLEFSLRQA